MTIVTSRDVYDQWHGRLAVDADADSPWHAMIKARLDAARDLAGKRVLEIGCGRGGFAMWLASHPSGPKEVVGCDFSPVAVAKAAEYAAAKGVGGVRWDVADIQKLDQFADGEFDTVTSTETIEHVPDPPLALRQLARVLRPGGRLFLTTPNYFSSIGLYRVYCGLIGKKFDECGQPLVQWTMIHRTRRWTMLAGLRVLEQDGIGQYLPFPGRPPIHLRFLEHPHFVMKWFGHHSLTVAEKPAVR